VEHVSRPTSAIFTDAFLGAAAFGQPVVPSPMSVPQVDGALVIQADRARTPGPPGMRWARPDGECGRIYTDATT